jgi:glutaminyl-tRNA synthetase
VKGTIHWLSAAHAVPCTIRLYDRLFSVEHPDGDKEVDFKQYLNPESLQIIPHSLIEPSLAELPPGRQVQFERLGYFCIDSATSTPGQPVFNRIVTLRDTWAKISQ